MTVERCPSCGGLIIDGQPCPHCTSPIPGCHGPVVEAPPRRALEVVPAPARSRVTVNLLVLGTGLYWIVTSFRQLFGALNNGPGSASLLLYVVAVLSLIVGVYAMYVAWMMYRRAYRIQGQLVLASVVGACWGVFVPLLLGNSYQLLVVPFHVLLGAAALAAPRYLGLPHRFKLQRCLQRMYE